jgi:FkbM family methyltransferase
MTFWFSLVKAIKNILFIRGEKYDFSGISLRFLANTRPARMVYLESGNDIVRNDLLQIKFLEKQFKPGQVIWDIGSHYGHYSIFAASVSEHKDRVYSFEPDAKARIVQEKNIAMNSLQDRIKIMDVAVSKEDGIVDFLELNGNSNSHIINGDMVTDSKVRRITSRSLDSLLKEIPCPDFVKIDTEGAEIDILFGGSALLSNPKVNFICELHPFAWDAFGVTYAAFVDLMQKHNRTITLLDARKKSSDLPFYGTVLF